MSKPLKTTNKRIIKMLEKMRDEQARAVESSKSAQKTTPKKAKQ